MESYCKNCGASLNSNEEFCPDCGSKINKDTATCKNCGQILSKDIKFCVNCGQPIKEEPANNFCPNCGNPTEAGQSFCSECGVDLNAPDKPESNFMSEHKSKMIAAGAVVAVLLIAAIFIAGSLFNGPGTQQVEVGSTDFIIPGDFVIEPASIDYDYKYSSAVFSKGWTNDDGDAIHISTMLVPYNVDANQVLASEGGSHMNIMGYSGYYTEDDGIYNFAFESGGYVCVVSTTDKALLDEIECLG